MANQGVVQDDLATPEPSRQWFRAALLILIALSTYTQIPLLSGGRLLVPSFPTIALAPLLLLTVWPNVSRNDEYFMLKIAFVLLLSIAFSPGYEYVTEKFFGMIQCGVAIGVAVLTVRLMQQLKKDVLERTLLVLSCLIVGGVILEVLGVIREVSDSFRHWAYDGAYTLYDRDLRDMDMVGWPRPKLFSVEPSHVTKFFIVAINSWLLIRVTWVKVAFVAMTTLLMLYIMGSPMLVVSAAITGAILVWNQRANFRSKAAMILVAVIIAVVFGIYYGGSSYSGVAERLSDVDATPSSTRDLSSEEQRLIYPYMTLANTWARWPVFGVGISGKEVVLENTNIRVSNADAAVGNNVMAEIGIYLGLVGGAWFIYLLLRQTQQTGAQRLGLVLILGGLFSQLMGGMESFRYWGSIALLWGAVVAADSRADGNASTTKE